MKDETYSNANAVARLYEIATSSNLSGQANIFIQHQQRAYDTWMAGGGAPDIIGQPLHTRGEFEIRVTRINGSDFAQTGLFQTIVMRAWKEMPLFIGDVIQAGSNSIAAIELLSGGRVGLKRGESLHFQDVGYALNLAPSTKGTVWDKFNAPAKPLTIQTRGGGSIKG